MFNNILIIKYGAIGDFIAGTVAINAIRQALPNTKITLLTTSFCSDIAPSGTIVDETILIDKYKGLRYFNLFLLLAKKKFDGVLNLRWDSEFSSMLGWILGIKVRIGLNFGKNKKFYNVLSPQYNDIDNRHEYLKNLDVASMLRIVVGKPEAYINVTEEEKSFSQRYLSNHLNNENYIVFSPTSSTFLKAWMPERYVELGKKFINEYGWKILISWAGDEYNVAKKIGDEIGNGAIVLPKLKLGELAEIIRYSHFCVCNNSGALHISYAVKTPVICFNTSKGWMPFGEKDISINSFPEDTNINLLYLSNNEVQKLLKKISVDRAWSGIKQMMHDLGLN